MGVKIEEAGGFTLSSSLYGYLLVVIAAILWATLGPFYKVILSLHSGFSPLNIVFFRTTLTAFVILIGFILRGEMRRRLNLGREDIPLFLGYGFFGVALFYAVYAYAIDCIGIGMAAVLMYTAPAWVAVISHFLFGEKLNAYKILAVLLAFTGCALVAQVYKPEMVRLNVVGILYGLAAGVTYGLYSIFNKLALRRHSSTETLFYSLGLGGLFLLPLQRPEAVLAPFRRLDLFLWLLTMSIIPTLGGGFCYITSLRYIPVSVASVVANLEPVTAAFLGVLFFHERLEWPQVLGALLVIGGVLVLQLSPSERVRPNLDNRGRSGHNSGNLFTGSGR